MAKRELVGVLRSLSERKTYRAVSNLACTFEDPVGIGYRYILGAGSYPHSTTLKTPIGEREVTLYSFDDVRSLIVCFAKEDYHVRPDLSCAVDFGSNIGMSGLYFLTRNPEARVYLFEPLPQNIARLRTNLSGLEGRYNLQECAVGLIDGTATFFHEPSGRYGGLTETLDDPTFCEREYRTEVTVREPNKVLREVLERHETIDILKVNIEGLEVDVLRAIEPDIRRRIRVICAEIFHFDGELEGFHHKHYGTNITRFTALPA